MLYQLLGGKLFQPKPGQECIRVVTNVIIFAPVKNKKLLYCLFGFGLFLVFFFLVELRKQFIFNFSKLAVLKTLVI